MSMSNVADCSLSQPSTNFKPFHALRIISWDACIIDVFFAVEHAFFRFIVSVWIFFDIEVGMLAGVFF